MQSVLHLLACLEERYPPIFDEDGAISWIAAWARCAVRTENKPNPRSSTPSALCEGLGDFLEDRLHDPFRLVVIALLHIVDRRSRSIRSVAGVGH